MKTAATPLRSLLLTLGALAAVVAVAWSVSARPKAADAVASDPHPVQASEIAVLERTAEPAEALPAAVEPVAAAPARRTPSTPATSLAPGEAGMRVFHDPETGGITHVPPRGYVDPLTVQRLERPDELPLVVLPDGSEMVVLDERFEEVMVMTLTPDGRRIVTCSQYPAAGHEHHVIPTHQQTLETREVK
jgi:hypothetical protein